jgi:2-dehydropantoate 2-reductase
MRILVFGAGAMGSFVGGLFANKNDHDVTFIGRRPHIAEIRRSGLKIKGKTELNLDRKAIIAYEDIEPVKAGCGPPGMVLVTVKSYDTNNIIPELKQIVGNDTILLSLQNGLDSVELLSSEFPENIVMGGTICHGVTFLGPGEVYHAGFGDTYIGAIERSHDKTASYVCQMFNEVGIETNMTKNICGEIWTKLAINASINPITAITGLKNGWLLKEPKLESLLEQTCHEVIEVAKRDGIHLPKGPRGNILERTRRVVEHTADNKSSMLQDLEKGRKTEIDSINGAVVRVGERNNMETPINRTLTVLVKSLEKQNVKDN